MAILTGKRRGGEVVKALLVAARRGKCRSRLSMEEEEREEEITRGKKGAMECDHDSCLAKV